MFFFLFSQSPSGQFICSCSKWASFFLAELPSSPSFSLLAHATSADNIGLSPNFPVANHSLPDDNDDGFFSASLHPMMLTWIAFHSIVSVKTHSQSSITLTLWMLAPVSFLVRNRILTTCLLMMMTMIIMSTITVFMSLVLTSTILLVFKH